MLHPSTATKLHRAPGAPGPAHGRIAPSVTTRSAAPVAPAAQTAPAAIAIAAVLAAGLLTFSVRTAGGAPSSGDKAPNLTIAGTTITASSDTPVPRVRITVMPDSAVTFTDADGDFLVSWSGRKGWITLIPEERARDGREWCKRVVLPEQSPESRDPIVDLGLITVMPRAQIGYQQVPTAPPAYPRPASLRVPGPKPGESDTCRVQLSYATDLWGRITRVEVSGGDQPPSGLKDAIFSWIRSVPWTVASETPCDSPEPFRTREWMDYAWADTAWVQVPGLQLKDRLKPPGKAPRSR